MNKEVPESFKEKIRSFLDPRNLKKCAIEKLFYALIISPLIAFGGDPTILVSSLGLNLLSNFIQEEYDKTQKKFVRTETEIIEEFKKIEDYLTLESGNHPKNLFFCIRAWNGNIFNYQTILDLK